MEARDATRHRLPSARALMITDSLALIAFVLTGAVSHHDAGLPAMLARNLGPLGVAWAVVAALFGTYRRRSWRAVVLTWAVAVPLGLSVRSWLVGEPRGSELLTFLLVGSAFSLLYLLIGRALLTAGGRLRARGVPA